MKPTVFVTGATGFLGRGFLEELHRRGHGIHALVRPTSDRSGLGDLPVRWHEGDITNPASVEGALRNLASEVEEEGLRRPIWAIHSAALIRFQSGGVERARSTNVEGTWNVLAACRRAGVGRVLHISSVVAVGHSRDGRPLNEDAEYNGDELGVTYMTTKRAAEDIALGMTGELDVVAINPGTVIGRGCMSESTLGLLRAAAEGRGPRLAPPGVLPLVDRDDVVAAGLRALDVAPRGRRYILVAENLPVRKLLTAAAELYGTRPPRWTVPAWIWRRLVSGVRLLDRLRPLERMGPEGLDLLGRAMAYDAARARAELGFDPAPIRESLHRTAVDFASRGQLPIPVDP